MVPKVALKHSDNQVVIYNCTQYLCGMEKNTISQLDVLENAVKEAKTGKELFGSFKEYSDFVLRNWPEDLIDSGRWKTEMASVLRKIEKKITVKRINNSPDLRSHREDALGVTFHFKKTFLTYFNGKGHEDNQSN